MIMKILHFFKKSTPPKTGSSEFSDFFRHASSGKKKAVFMDIARKASTDQRRVIEAAK
jgi:hypothetical protein